MVVFGNGKQFPFGKSSLPVGSITATQSLSFREVEYVFTSFNGACSQVVIHYMVKNMWTILEHGFAPI